MRPTEIHRKARVASIAWPVAVAVSMGLAQLVPDRAAASAIQMPRPPQVVALEPDETARLPKVDAVRVVLDFTRGPAADPSAVELSLDETPLAGPCATRSTRDIPPSRVEIACPLPELAPGEHIVKLRLKLEAGGHSIYRWPIRTNGP